MDDHESPSNFEPLGPPPTTPGQPRPHSNPPFVFKHYEVKCPDTFAWYTGYIKDLVEEDGQKKLKIRYRDDWKEEQIVDLEDVRPAPNRHAHDRHWIPILHESCEAQAKSAPTEPYGWWGCKIQSAKEGYYLINFNGWSNEHNEVLGPDMLRPVNTNEDLSKYQSIIAKKRVKIPQELVEMARTKTGELVGFIERLKKILHFDFDPETNSIIVIGDKEEVRCSEALLIHDMRLKLELQKLDAGVSSKQAALEQKKKLYDDAVKEEIQIMNKDLIKYVLGRQGKNIKQAKAIDGIIDIKVQDDQPGPAIVQIWAKVEKAQAAKEARDLLEIVLATCPVPANCMGAIIGQKGQTITEIQRDSAVIRIKSWQKWLNEGGKSQEMDQQPESYCAQEDREYWGDCEVGYFVIIGKKACVKIARFLIALKAKAKREAENIRQREKQIMKKMQEYENRSSRGGMDGGGRGGMRGGRSGARRGGGYDGGRRRDRNGPVNNSRPGGGGGGNRRNTQRSATNVPLANKRPNARRKERSQIVEG